MDGLNSMKLYLCLFPQLFFASILLAEAPAGHYDPDPIAPEIMNSFTTAIYKDTEWVLPESAIGGAAVLTPQEKLIWAGSEISTTFVQGDPTIDFSAPATADTPEKSFSLTLHFAPKQIVFHSTAPVSAKFASGAALPYSLKSSFRKFIIGGDGSGFVALIPRSSNTDWYGIAICPRDRIIEKKTHYFSPTTFAPNFVTASVEGKLVGSETTGDIKVQASGEILTTRNIARSKPWHEAENAENANIDMEYFVDKTDTELATTNLLYSGIRMHGLLISAHGGKREKTVESFTRVEPFQFSSPITFVQNGLPFTLDSGPCFAIFRGVTEKETVVRGQQQQSSSSSSEASSSSAN